MELKDFARGAPAEVWAVFEPLLPATVWRGNGRPPASDRACFDGLCYVLVTGIGWEYLPPCFPSYKTVRRRLSRWLEADVFRRAWAELAERHRTRAGVNWDKLCLDGAKRPAKKGARRPAPARSTAARRARA